MRDVNTADLIDLMKQFSCKESVIQFRSPIAHGEIEVQILGRGGVRVSGSEIEYRLVEIGAVDHYSSSSGIFKPRSVHCSSCIQAGYIKNQRLLFRCVNEA